ncbi:c-type cytochrome [Deinococcus cellulosilyticus]|uniref:Cytochrome c domain-containing protein n=1 Tax=Deinococcus cellulosilyticus (strain DSM 18568 / NBRC 106333 / KACC 11606 / 5516J-15) TaxID=1223518 RepID=A0A511N4E4_DEIC1|nr:cytochrome c [Deinococcus cellulosilyticus]GEM47348.1 hypothetical protein DC3_29830 [Deinococcus cellulosilyticus NBRC 106333 = KACC 11606]
MRKTVLLLIALSSGLVLAADPKGNAASGKTLYSSTCQMCHGDKGQGMVGPKLAGTLAKWKFADFKKTLVKGVNPSKKTLAATMPRYDKTPFMGTGKPPTDQQMADVLAYIKTLK